MAKAKFDPKDFLLKKGEFLAMGISGFILAVLLIYGATKWTSAQDPAKTAAELKQKSQSVHTAIQNGQPSDADADLLKLPPWITVKPSFETPKVPAFSQVGQLFDPTAQPSTKRDNPNVLPIGAYQVDLTRSAMLGYDIVQPADGEALIAVLTESKVGKHDKDKVNEAALGLKIAAARGKAAQEKIKKQAEKQKNNMNMGFGPMGFPGGPMGPMGFPGGPAPMGPGPMGPGMGRFGGEGAGGHGGYMGMGGYMANEQRSTDTKAIKYIPLADIDKAVTAGNLPAITVIPLRLVTVHAVVPYKKQVEELKRALRLTTDAEAKQWGPWYDGFEVQRRVTRRLPNGTVLVEEDWPEKPSDPKDTSGNYKFEEKYIDVIDTRKIADHFDEGYIPYFLKPEMMLAMPLPALAKDLNVKYPDVKIKDITDNIDKLKKANQKEIPASELAKQLAGSKPKNSIYAPKTAEALGGVGYNPNQFGVMAAPTGMGMGMPPVAPPSGPGMVPGGPGPMRPGQPAYPEGGYAGVTVANEVDNFMLRFVDCDVTPGRTYEYRIRLRMWNPNFNQKDLVANPEFAKENYKTLYSGWIQLATPISVPAESFLYAHDVKAYRDQINTTYPPDSKEAEAKEINKLLQVKDNQAVLQVATWMEQVLTAGGKREPVGAWVVAEIPVGRGEYVGRKQFIKLPLWSSEAQPQPQYLLREVGDKVVKGKAQPKGWLVDFSTRSVLVDFEGGKVKSRTKVQFDPKTGAASAASEREINEDVATEVLIVRPDGKLIVRSSAVDDVDPNRKAITSEWTRWVKEIEGRKSAVGGMGEEMNPFGPKGKGP